jgi:c-di-GMP-binding flagellar brake protein YcgR
MDKIPERRKHVRIKTPYITRFRVKPCDGEASNNWETFAVVNLSAGGLFFYSSVNLEVSTILDLEISFSHIYHAVICVGKVIRVTKHPVTSINGYAVEFTEIDEQVKKMINKNLKSQNYNKN